MDVLRDDKITYGGCFLVGATFKRQKLKLLQWDGGAWQTLHRPAIIPHTPWRWTQDANWNAFRARVAESFVNYSPQNSLEDSASQKSALINAAADKTIPLSKQAVPRPAAHCSDKSVLDNQSMINWIDRQLKSKSVQCPEPYTMRDVKQPEDRTFMNSLVSWTCMPMTARPCHKYIRHQTHRTRPITLLSPLSTSAIHLQPQNMHKLG